MNNWDVIAYCISRNWQLILLHNARLAALGFVDWVEAKETEIREEKCQG